MGYGQVISKNFSAGGTMGGDLTLDGDLIVNGDGSGNYDEIVNGNLTVSSTNKLVLGGDGSDSYIFESAADALDLYAGGAQMLQLLEGSSDYVWVPLDTTKFAIGAGKDLQIYHDGSHNYIDAVTGDQDIIFKGTDSSSDITALTLDMSEAGAATFNSDVTVGALLKMPTNTAAKILVADGTSYEEASMSGDATIASGGAVTLASTNTNLTTLANVTTVGALDAGSITSGFTSIDVGAGAITTTGTVTGGQLSVDDITINGSTISDGGDFTLDIGGDITLDANGGQINVNDDGATHFLLDCDATQLVIYDDQDTGDLFSITVAQHGATTIATTDDDATAGHLTLDVDGNITMDADGGTITFADAGSSLGTITSSGYSGTSAVATAVTVADESSDTSCNVLYVTAATGDLPPKSGTNLTFNSSSGVLTATGFAGALTGDVTGNCSGTAATVTTAAQSNITSLGTLTTLTVDNVIVNGTTIGHTSDTDLMTLASGGLTVAGTIAVGANTDGHDVTFYGNGNGKYMLWDESEDTLAVAGTLQTQDLVLNNERGHYLIVEEEEYLSIKNEKTGKLYKFVLEEIDG
tara:strand:- start:741 stop:2483 length:1743 start_codon:yes stop_codon:yes gene_type:complete